MNFRDLYQKDIDREINPAVSADDMTDATVNTEIEEYVFTEEIVNGLNDVIGGIMRGQKSHNGIWVSGYFGSGKSHFMKYIDYCFSEKHGPVARKRVGEAVRKFDPLKVPGSKSLVPVADWNSVELWLQTAKVETVVFNIGAVHNSHTSQDQVFTDVFWNQFNKMRGFNEFSVPLAQFLEAPLEKAGVFEAFKKKLKDDGFDWESDAYQLSINELDYVLDTAKELLPTLSTDAVRERIVKNDMVLSVKVFIDELKKFVDSKPSNYRLVFCADEISQFIDGRKELLLQLQELVTGFHNSCGNKVWLVCTAQKDLSEVLDDCHVNQTSEDFGKIMGRYEIKVSLTGTNVDFITKKRILEKKPAAEIDLRSMYKKIQTALPAQYQLPAGYDSYEDESSFVDAYPFVSYQFKLVGQVFNAFRNKEFVDKEVKDSARSVLNVTFRVAKETKDTEVGKFISFDQFFNTMFKGSLSAMGQRSLKNADDIAADYSKDPAFARRVVSVLFMVCNLDVAVQQTFPASVDNVTTLLLRDLATPKLTLKHDVEDVIKFLCDKNVLQAIPAKGTIAETFQFYTEDEIEVATAIKNKTADTTTMANELKEVIFKALGNPPAKESHHTGRFSVGVDILGRNFLSHNAAVSVSFLFDSNGESLANVRLKNNDNSLCFFIADLYAADHEFRSAFNWVCQAQMYFHDTPAASETRAKTVNRFREKVREKLQHTIEPAISRFLESCPVVSGQGDVALPAEKPSERYKKAMDCHLAHLYSHAAEVDTFPTDANTLAKKILRPIEEGEYGPLNGLTDAETSVENFLNAKKDDFSVRDVVDRFKKEPYGWDENCTLYALNELVRRGIRDFAYMGTACVSAKVVADKIVNDTAHFSIRKKSAIAPAVLSSFSAAWKQIFGPTVFKGPISHTPGELIAGAKKHLEAEIAANTNAIESVNHGYAFIAPVEDERTEFRAWLDERDETTFFTAVTSAASAAATRRNETNQIRDFVQHQYARFRDGVVDFAAKNNTNASFLAGDKKTDFEKLRVAKSDPTPYSNLPSYLNIARAVAAEFDSIRSAKRAKIDEVYGACFDDLEALAASRSVDPSAFDSRQTKIAATKQPDDLMSLENAINSVHRYKSEQVTKILAAIPPAPSPVGGEPPKPTSCLVHLKTSTTKPLTNETEVDAYLAGFKAKLMEKINSGQEVIVA